jgi:hypothetical protein
MTIFRLQIFKFSHLLHGLTAAMLLATPINSFGIRFNMEDDGFGRQRTVYPEAVKNVSKRSEEVKDLIKASPLAANFPYLHLTDRVKKEGGLERYLSLTAEIVISQAEARLQLPLRKFYFEGTGSFEQEDIFRSSGGRRLYRAILKSQTSEPEIHFQVISGIKSDSLVMRLLKLMAVSDISHQAVARRIFPHYEARLFYPVEDMVSKIVGALLIEEVLARMGHDMIIDEISKLDLNAALRATLLETFGRSHLRSQSLIWYTENPEVRAEQLDEWISLARQQRSSKSAAILGLSSIDRDMDTLVNSEISAELAKHPGHQFLLARVARDRGDSRKLHLLKSHFLVIQNDKSCEVSFISK